MKTTIILMFTGAFVGAAVASVVVPPALAWYTSPGGLPQGGQIPSVVQIPEVIRYATTSLIRGQAIGAGIGAAIGLAMGLALSVNARRARREAIAAKAPSSANEQPPTNNQ